MLLILEQSLLLMFVSRWTVLLSLQAVYYHRRLRGAARPSERALNVPNSFYQRLWSSARVSACRSHARETQDPGISNAPRLKCTRFKKNVHVSPFSAHVAPLTRTANQFSHTHSFLITGRTCSSKATLHYLNTGARYDMHMKLIRRHARPWFRTCYAGCFIVGQIL